MSPLLWRAAPALLTALASAAYAQPVFETNDPFGGWLGLNGFDVFAEQKVAARFIPASGATLTSVSIWFMSNDDAGTTPQTVTVSLRTDAASGEFASVPSGTVLESWTTDLPIAGWNPELITFDSSAHPALASGQRYWIVAESNLPAFVDPIWCWSSEGNEFTATANGLDAPWTSGSGAALALVVEGSASTPACPADLGAAGGVPGRDGALDNNDFIAFISLFFNQNAAADVGAAGGVAGQDGVWDNNDFIAFINQFFSGC
ncbi:MAG: hypothetical protein K2Q09_05725 [Phycisphaerales bacterium]|nr:hypothetical protein [Phycisphaerales bacterium]